MTAKDLAIVVKGMAPVVSEIVKAAVDNAVAPYVARIAALEAKEAVTVYNGKDGLPGQKGLDGAPGVQGPAGPPGPAGERGERGEPGAAGAIGDRGPEGPEGKPGRDGRDGMTVQGPAGEKGLDGKDGRNGLDGKDGLGFDEFEELYDGERTITHRYKSGTRVKEFVWKMPFMIQRGVFSEGKAYERGDVVTWGGSQWHCNEETTVKPGDGMKSWTLVVKRGRDGKDGKDATTVPIVKVGG